MGAKKINEARVILNKLGLPKAQQNEMAALTLLALANLKPGDSWSLARKHSTSVSKGIMAFVHKYYGREYAPNTRETFRRQVLHQFNEAGVVDYNPDNPGLPVNSPRAHYALTDHAVKVIASYGKPKFQGLAKVFCAALSSRAAAYQNARNLKRVPLKLPTGKTFSLSPGKHNEVVAAVVKDFCSRFAPDTIVLYLGDTEDKEVVFDVAQFEKIGARLKKNGKLPDLVLLQPTKRWLFLIEAVTSHGPVSQKRVVELKQIFGDLGYGLIFVSAFPNIIEFKKHAKDIAWDTEVWLADAPDHLIHFNGDRFFGPR